MADIYCGLKPPPEGKVYGDRLACFKKGFGVGRAVEGRQVRRRMRPEALVRQEPVEEQQMAVPEPAAGTIIVPEDPNDIRGWTVQLLQALARQIGLSGVEQRYARAELIQAILNNL